MSIFLVGLYVRSIHAMAMGLNVIPLKDSYADYAYTAVSISEGRASIHTEPLGAIRSIPGVSQWPLLHLFAIQFSQITGVGLIEIASFIFPTIIWTITFLIVYVFSKCLLKSLGLETQIALMISLLYAILPHVTYETMQYIRGNFALLWIYLLLYVVVRISFGERPTRVDKVLAAIFTVCLVVSHNLTALLFFVFLITAWIFYKLWRRFPSRMVQIRLLKRNPFSLLRLYSVVLLSWWLYYGTLAFIYGRNLLRLFHPIGYEYLRQLQKVNLEQLRPPLIMSLVALRDIILYGFVAMGILCFLYIVGRRFIAKDIGNSWFTVSLLIAVSCVFILGGLLVGNADKTIAFFAPALLLFSGFCFQILKKTRLRQLILLTILVIAGLGVALAPYSHSYAPVYLYDDSLRAEETNAHNPDYWRISSFLNYHIGEKPTSYVSDDGRILYLILPTQEFNNVESIGLSFDYEDIDADTFIVRFGNYSDDQDFWIVTTSNANKVYSSGLPEIWIKSTEIETIK